MTETTIFDKIILGGNNNLKYCTNCGAELNDNDTYCTRCGHTNDCTEVKNSDKSGIKFAIKFFMILGCVASALYLFIPLCWTIPMTITYFNKIKINAPISTGFKICTLLFLNVIAGILLLCDN